MSCFGIKLTGHLCLKLVKYQSESGNKNLSEAHTRAGTLYLYWAFNKMRSCVARSTRSVEGKWMSVFILLYKHKNRHILSL